jgi:hypothetical protein
MAAYMLCYVLTRITTHLGLSDHFGLITILIDSHS